MKDLSDWYQALFSSIAHLSAFFFSVLTHNDCLLSFPLSKWHISKKRVRNTLQLDKNVLFFSLQKRTNFIYFNQHIFFVLRHCRLMRSIFSPSVTVFHIIQKLLIFFSCDVDAPINLLSFFPFLSILVEL